MSFIACIDTAVATGKITAKRGEEAKAAFQEALDEAAAKGLNDRMAADAATEAAVNALTARVQANKWRKINQMRRAHELYLRANSTTNFGAEFNKLVDEMEEAKQTVFRMAQARWAAAIEKYRPRLVGVIHPIRDLREVVDVGYGAKAKNPSVKEVADSFKDTWDFLRRMANSFGARIPESPNHHGLPQQHDHLKMRRIAGKGKKVADSKKIWVEDHLARLDWDLMKSHYDHKPIPEGKRVEILERVFDLIVTDGYAKIKPGQANRDVLAARLDQPRFLYYKDAKSWHEMAEKYGSGNVYQQMVGAIESMSRDIALLRKLGPDPEQNRVFFENAMKSRSSELEAQTGTRDKSQRARVDQAITTFTDRYAHFRNFIPTGEESVVAKSLSSGRTVTASLVLGTSFFANLNDVGLAKHAAMFYRIPAMKVFRGYVKEFFGQASKKDRMLALRLGLGNESATQVALGFQRYFGAEMGSAVARRFADSAMRFTLVSPLTQAGRHMWGKGLMGTFADLRLTEFDNLPFAGSLRDYGISKADWDLFRSTPLLNDRGATYLTPIDLWNRTDGNAARNQRVAERFMDFIHHTGRLATPERSTLEDAWLLGQSAPGGFHGEFLRTSNALISFPLIVNLRHHKEFMLAPTRWGIVGNFARFFAVLTMFGAVTYTLREIAEGRDIPDSTSPAFWVKSLMYGGGLGFLGDSIASILGLQAGPEGFSETFGGGGPLTDFLDRFLGVGQEAIEDLFLNENKSNAAGKMVEASQRLFGFWPIKTLFRRALFDELLRAADPVAYRRMLQREQKRERETGQGNWWEPGNALPSRLPDFRAQGSFLER